VKGTRVLITVAVAAGLSVAATAASASASAGAGPRVSPADSAPQGSAYEQWYNDGLDSRYSASYSGYWLNGPSVSITSYEDGQAYDAWYRYGMDKVFDFAGHTEELTDPDGNPVFNGLLYDAIGSNGQGTGDTHTIVPTTADADLLSQLGLPQAYPFDAYNSSWQSSPLKVALLESCQSAVVTPYDNTSLAQAVWDTGPADMAVVGFTQNVYFNLDQSGVTDSEQYGVPFQDAFFRALSYGESVSYGAESGENLEYSVYGDYYGYDSWQIIGDGNLTWS
jgi:hypothetical protein